MWLIKMGPKWEKNGGNGGEVGRNTHFSVFPELEYPPHSSLWINQLTVLTEGKIGIFATHRHSPPWRLVRMLGVGPCWSGSGALGGGATCQQCGALSVSATYESMTSGRL